MRKLGSHWRFLSKELQALAALDSAGRESAEGMQVWATMQGKVLKILATPSVAQDSSNGIR